MIPNEEIDLLSEEIRRRHDRVRSRKSPSATSPVDYDADADDPEQQPFVLFLGPACATAAGVPVKEQLARLMLDLATKDEELTKMYPRLQSEFSLIAGMGGTELLQLFYGLMDELKEKASSKVYRMLLKFYANVPVPLFYQNLALLIKASFFERILTTNIDTLLEQALNIAGLQPAYDYQVTSLGMANSSTSVQGSYGTPSDWNEFTPQKQIIKLFGDLAQEQVNINTLDIDSALRSQRRYVKGELEGDIVMVGYDFESKPINKWLKKGGQRRSQLWWVGAETPSPPSESFPDKWATQVHFITGKIGSPEEFFSQLKLRLQRRPTFELSSYPGVRRKPTAKQDEVTRSVESAEATNSFSQISGPEVEDDSGSGAEAMRSTREGLRDGTDSSLPPVGAPMQEPSASADINGVATPEELLIEDLRGNIRRSQAVLFSLEQTAAPGDVPPSVQAQVAYQKQQIAGMEDRIRSLASSRQSIIQILDVIRQDVRRARDTHLKGKTEQFVSETTYRFLKQQCQSIKDEYKQDEPNDFVISAAIGATVMLAERLCIELGKEFVKPEDVRRLAAFAPSVAGRGLI